MAYWSYAVTKTTWLRPATWRATSPPVISGIWRSRNMKPGARSSSASSAAAPSSTEAMITSSGQSFLSLPSSWVRRIGSSFAAVPGGAARLCRGVFFRVRLAAAAPHEPPDAEPDEDEGREHREERHQDDEWDEDREPDEEESQPVHHREHDREGEHQYREGRGADEGAGRASDRFGADLDRKDAGGHADHPEPGKHRGDDDEDDERER